MNNKNIKCIEHIMDSYDTIKLLEDFDKYKDELDLKRMDNGQASIKICTISDEPKIYKKFKNIFGKYDSK